MNKNKTKTKKTVDPEEILDNTTANEDFRTKSETDNGNETTIASAADRNDANDSNADNTRELTAEETIAALEQQLEEQKTALLYKAAEFENYRKRTIKEKADLILNGGQKVMEALLPVADDLERAEQSTEKATDVEALKKGLQLVFQKFTKTLEGLGLKKMDVVGEDFNTDYHEAIAFVPGSEEQKGKVVDCVQNGYMLNDHVIRFAKVAVGQ